MFRPQVLGLAKHPSRSGYSKATSSSSGQEGGLISPRATSTRLISSAPLSVHRDQARPLRDKSRPERTLFSYPSPTGYPACPGASSPLQMPARPRLHRKGQVGGSSLHRKTPLFKLRTARWSNTLPKSPKTLHMTIKRKPRPPHLPPLLPTTTPPLPSAMPHLTSSLRSAVTPPSANSRHPGWLAIPLWAAVTISTPWSTRRTRPSLRFVM